MSLNIASGYSGYKSWTRPVREQVTLHATTDPASPLLAAFFEEYDKAFVLPEEKEELAGFQACLALNGDADFTRLQSLYGPFREPVLVLQDDRSGAVIGGANFCVFALPGLSDSVNLSCNLNYIFIAEEFRGKGWFRHLADLVTRECRLMFGSSTSVPLVFVELNDPLRLTEEQQRADRARSGLDQWDRLSIWARLGARWVDYRYTQPPLAPTDRSDEGYLIYAVLNAQENLLSAGLLEAHLRRFFAISVLKGAPVEACAVAMAQLEELHTLATKGKPVRLLDPMPVINARMAAGSLPLAPSALDLLHMLATN